MSRPSFFTMSKDQLAAVHQARQRLEKLSGGAFDRDAYDALLTKLGGVRSLPPSSKGMTKIGFERVMAKLEEMIAKHDPAAGTYWRSRLAQREHFASPELLEEIVTRYGQAVAAGVTYPLAAIVSQMSNSRTRDAVELNPAEAKKVIEMLKAVTSRQEAKRQ